MRGRPVIPALLPTAVGRLLLSIAVAICPAAAIAQTQQPAAAVGPDIRLSSTIVADPLGSQRPKALPGALMPARGAGLAEITRQVDSVCPFCGVGCQLTWNVGPDDQGAERKPPHVPADMPPADYKGEDYQLDQAVALLRAGKATPGGTNMVQAAPAPATP